MSNTIAHVYRGELIESVHRGHFVFTRANGDVVLSYGKPEIRAYWRSSAKPIQVIPLVCMGGVDRFRFTDEELAVMCASHAGQPFHVAAVQSILRKIGLDESALRCGAHMPFHQPTAKAMADRLEEPRPVHCNCSGKHAGMLATAVLLGVDPRDYYLPEHPVQREIISTVKRLTGVEELTFGTDGCGVPVFGLSVQSMSLAWARFADQTGIADDDASAIRRISDAMVRFPEMVSGTDLLCTHLMKIGKGKIIAKGGAEGIYCFALPEKKLGFALKVEDGNARAIGPTILRLLHNMGVLIDLEASKQFSEPILRNHAGTPIGIIRPAFEDVGVSLKVV